MTAAPAGTPRVRPAEPADLPTIVAMVHELADYERAPKQCELTESQLAAALFASVPALFGHVGLNPEGQPVGFALWFLNFSTWRGRHGIYLEDLYVRPAYRGAGVGRALLAELAATCLRRGYARLEWWVLDWNEPALNFYRALGAEAMSEWTVQRLSGAPLRRLGAAADVAATGPAGTP